jgi:Tfp pilus assembly protein PilN
MQGSNSPKSRSVSGNPDIVAAVRSRAGGHAAIVVSKSGSSWKVIAEALLDSPAAVAAFVQTHQAGRLVRLAPAADTLAKCCDIPVAEGSQMIAAAALLAEAELPSVGASHRRAGGLLPGGRSGVRAALVAAWIDRGEAVEAIAPGAETFCTPVAALAALRGDSAAVACVDAAGGAFAILVCGQERSMVRVVLEDETDATALSLIATQALEAAAASVGERSAAVGREVILEASARAAVCAKVEGCRNDAAWFDQYGLQVGAALLTFSPESAPLAGLLAEPPEVDEPLPVRCAKWLSQGHRAWWVGAAACGVLLFAPLGLATVRDSMLSQRVGIIEDMKKNNADVERQAAMYAQLDLSRWPLTKLLSDISSATPVGVASTDLRLSPEQGFTFQGTAKSADLVNAFQQNLSTTKLFRSIKVNRTETVADGSVEFNLSAEIIAAQVHLPVKPISDFAAESLSKRLHGVETSGSGESSASSSGGSGRRGDRRGESEQAESRRPSTPSDAMPPAVTDDEIKKMDKATANRAWVARKVYVQKNPTLDAATKQRLQDEEAKIRAHAAAAPGGGT